MRMHALWTRPLDICSIAGISGNYPAATTCSTGRTPTLLVAATRWMEKRGFFLLDDVVHLLLLALGNKLKLLLRRERRGGLREQYPKGKLRKLLWQQRMFPRQKSDVVHSFLPL